MQTEYKTNPKDFLYSIRSDISMFYHNNKRFIGNSFYSYYVFGRLANKMSNPEILKDFSHYISRSIQKLYSVIICEENKKSLGEKFIKEKNYYNLSISFINKKIDVIIEILLIYIFDIELITSTLFLYFIVKQIAIKFDEIFDSIFNMINYMEEGKKLEKILLEEKILPLNLKTQNFVKNLRNNIHYIEYDWNVNEGLINLETIFKNQA